MNSAKDIFRRFFPYLLIFMLCIFTYNYSKIFIDFDLDGYYGKRIEQKAYAFKLKDANGKRVELSDFEGRFVLLTFGFTKCNGVCPLNLHRFKKLSKILTKSPSIDLSFVFISFDEIRDTSEEMQLFLENFQLPNVYGLLSDKEAGLDVAREYKNHINFEKEEIRKDPSYQVNHNGFLYLIDPFGNLALIYMQQEIDEKLIIDDIKKLNNKFQGRV